MKFLLKARQEDNIHSEMGGPWMPELVVMGMSEEVKMGWWAKWSMPAEKRWMSLRLGGAYQWEILGIRSLRGYSRQSGWIV